MAENTKNVQLQKMIGTEVVNVMPKTVSSLVEIADGIALNDIIPNDVSEDNMLLAANSIEVATEFGLGLVQPDGDTISIDEDGVISANYESYVDEEIENLDLIEYEVENEIENEVESEVEYQIGDKLTKSLTGLGEFQFTCVEVDNTDAYFICDEIVSKQVFNSDRSKGNDYATSDLKTYVDGLGVEGLTIPTKAQLTKWYSSNSDRIAQYNGTVAEYWTSSAYPNDAYFAYFVGSDGLIGIYHVCFTHGVRPCFAISKTTTTTTTTTEYEIQEYINVDGERAKAYPIVNGVIHNEPTDKIVINKIRSLTREEYDDLEEIDESVIYYINDETGDSDVDVDIATTETAGIVKPDGETILIDEEGVISANVENYNDTELRNRISTVESSVNGINSDLNGIKNKIPSQASSSNQLADKDFVNSSISTNTATYRGRFNSLSALQSYTGTKTNNDYAYVVTTDENENEAVVRYKYNGTTWVEEFDMNNTIFTANQLATINSGLTAEDKTKLDGIQTGGSSSSSDGSKLLKETEFDFWNNNYIIKDENGSQKEFNVGDVITFAPTTDWVQAIYDNPDQYIKNLYNIPASANVTYDDIHITYNGKNKFSSTYPIMISYSDPNRSGEIVCYFIKSYTTNTDNTIIGPIYTGLYGPGGLYKTAVGKYYYLVVGYGSANATSGTLYGMVFDGKNITSATDGVRITKRPLSLNAYEDDYAVLSTQYGGFLVSGPHLTTEYGSTSRTQYAVHISSEMASVYSRFSTGLSLTKYIKPTDEAETCGGRNSYFDFYYESSGNVYFVRQYDNTEGGITSFSSATTVNLGAYPVTKKLKSSAFSYLTIKDNKIYYTVMNNKSLRGHYELPFFEDFFRCGGSSSYLDVAYIEDTDKLIWFEHYNGVDEVNHLKYCEFSNWQPVEVRYLKSHCNFEDGKMHAEGLPQYAGFVDYIPIEYNLWGSSTRRGKKYSVSLDPETNEFLHYPLTDFFRWYHHFFYMNKNVFLVWPINKDSADSLVNSNGKYIGIIPMYNYSNKINGIAVEKPISSVEYYQLVCDLDKNNQKIFRVLNRTIKEV